MAKLIVGIILSLSNHMRDALWLRPIITCHRSRQFSRPSLSFGYLLRSVFLLNGLKCFLLYCPLNLEELIRFVNNSGFIQSFLVTRLESTEIALWL